MYSTLSTLNTTTEVPLSKAPNPQLLPGRCSINGFPLRAPCVCSLLCVCTLGWVMSMSHYFVTHFTLKRPSMEQPIEIWGSEWTCLIRMIPVMHLFSKVMYNLNGLLRSNKSCFKKMHFYLSLCVYVVTYVNWHHKVCHSGSIPSN